jgi:hypothetical protein
MREGVGMKFTLSQLLVILIIVIVIIGGAIFGIRQLRGSHAKTRQAVFLTNGQVYFGYTHGENNKTVTLTDVYYLQVQADGSNSVQPAKDKTTSDQTQVSLVKLGNELHGPQDAMRINRDQVLFIEDMKDNSKVNSAIDDFIKNGGQTSTPSATPTPAATK